MTSDEARRRIEKETDFVYLPRFDNSVGALMERYPDGVPEKLIAQGLMMTEEEVEMCFFRLIKKLRRVMGVKVDGL